MKKNAKVVAVDGSDRIEVTIRFNSRYGLTQNETKQVARAAAEKIADAIRTIPFVDYGPSNTVVTL
jgi:hypothetical protein